MAFGNTYPRAREQVLGRAERAGSGSFDSVTGEGYVAPVRGEYARALEAGCDVEVHLFETFGGFGPEVVALLCETAELAQDRLSTREWDLNSWSATRWLTYAAQRVSVALHKTVAYEVLGAVGLANVALCVTPAA